MCGIFGVVHKKLEREKALECLNTLAHRGPDAYGLWQQEDVTLGHRRLSILDLSDNGKQPMSYANGRYWLTFNGEIYNFIELRKELCERGYTFHGESDSEVILAAFTEWREKCLEHFNGMWAFAIWDNAEKKLFLSRDRFGVKPLFYVSFEDGGFAFASEMKALLPLLKEVKPNKPLFEQYLSDLHYENGEECLIKEIKRFPAGSYAWLAGDKLKITKWWNTLDYVEDIPEPYEEQVEHFRELFLDACKIRMRSDVTLGTALSGGLDSSATICAMAHLSKRDREERMCQNWQHAYIASFPETFLDETVYARKVTEYLGIENTFINANMPVDSSQFLKDLYYFEELWNNPNIPMMELYKQERNDGTIVSVDGHASDELFGGYAFDVKKAYADIRGSREEISNVTRAYLDERVDPEELTEEEYIRRGRRLYWEAVLKNKAKKVLGRAPVRSTYSGHENWSRLDILNRTLFVSTHETILPTLLRNYDRDSMANGIEIRMPFLDYRLVVFAFSIGWQSKIRNGYTKAIVRDAVSPYMPAEIAYRKTKIGFNAPAADWMRGPYKEFYLDMINSAAFANCDLIRDVKNARKDCEWVMEHEESTFEDAVRVWQQIQPYFWEQGFLKQVWR